jgi:DNA polymerase/3'-5' exonuclease PolX
MNGTGEKEKWPLKSARELAVSMVALLEPVCLRIAIAGSVRRGKPEVGDIEIVYVPRLGAQPAGAELFSDERTQCNLADARIAELERSGVLERRLNAKGRESFGELNKLMRHAASGMPVDLFATTELCWFNYLVCRTGGAENNIAICRAAQAMGWKWTPYGEGFSRGHDRHAVQSEREVFEFVGLPYLEPEDRP